MDFPDRMFALGAEFSAKAGDFWSMVSPQSGPLAAMAHAGTSLLGNDPNNPYAIGGKRSFVPVLGEIVWELPKARADHVPFSAYICQVSDGRQIGYVRVPHYTYDEGAVSEFAELIARFESTTAAMVLDQVNNPGGSMFHMYAILSTLTDRALVLPQHQITISEDDVAIAAETVAIAAAGEAVPSDERPSPELVAYSRFVLSEIEAGRGTADRLTNPVHLGGVAEVLPAKNHYTKKIVVLINELDFSAAEFLAAILQDNKRATLFGERTAGAGGCVRRITIPNQFGIDYFTITWTFARRTNGQPIEDIGVRPDVKYSKTAEDLRSGWPGYRQALLATISA
ncbi:protease-like activity factor CPAF [Thermodesulfobacteriota bacterium]